MFPLIVDYIREETHKHNQNNITRTKAYQNFYKEIPEVKWALLASMVSRNAGYNMCDLQSHTYRGLLPEHERKSLYLTFENINWYIFQDAYPQLLIYKLSKENKTPLFFLLKYFHVSKFMEDIWYDFYQKQSLDKLMYAQIVNEQNIIEKPIMTHYPYEEKVFHKMTFMSQDLLHLNAVLLPTRRGRVYGTFISRFRNLNHRISIGKKIANLLFYPYLYPLIKDFAVNTEVTGSRYEYEQYMDQQHFSNLPLEKVYHYTVHHLDYNQVDWSTQKRIKKKWFKDEAMKNPDQLDRSFYQKRNKIRMVERVKN
ncbi:DUF2515 domain-containing protein [Halalkalibacillus sediminis]|uniref:DUF2515 domain-containing protein n=1 Tax=Halalkalibacillus sediminis TaxID=2018042 RepID=A0A2I0QWU1_9BACI|nr:DUF2515 family protein [Halalkalibacillus sediminis]PKR78817.1 DUF2515 domain-containing protein [Halalkalibacillus sediminis]